MNVDVCPSIYSPVVSWSSICAVYGCSYCPIRSMCKKMKKTLANVMSNSQTQPHLDNVLSAVGV